MRLAWLLIGLFLLASCASETPQLAVQEPVAEPPVVETPPAPTAPDSPFVNATQGVTFDGPITSVACDRATSTITFSLENPTAYTWHLDKDLTFPTPKGQSVARLSLNGVEMNSGFERTFNGQVLFGDRPFSQHCDKGLVPPEETVTCTVTPVPLKERQGVDAMTNELSLNTQGVFKVVTFLC